MSTPAKSLPRLTISLSASSVRLRGVAQRDPIPGHDQPIGRRLVALPGAAAGEDHVLGGERSQATAAYVAGYHPAAASVPVHQQRRREPLLVEIDRLVVAHQLL